MLLGETRVQHLAAKSGLQRRSSSSSSKSDDKGESEERRQCEPIRVWETCCKVYYIWVSAIITAANIVNITSVRQSPPALVRTDPTLLIPSPPGPPNRPLKVIKQHGDSATQDREPVSDGYTPRHYYGGSRSISASI